METTMDGKKPDSRTIAEEAVGERRESPTPDAVRDKADMPTEEVIRQRATSLGSQASRAAKTAEALGERDGGAYADAITDEAKERSRRVARHAASQASRAAQEQRFMRVAAGFALGYAAALLIHRRQ
jgi:hypothetical protein